MKNPLTLVIATAAIFLCGLWLLRGQSHDTPPISDDLRDAQTQHRVRDSVDAVTISRLQGELERAQTLSVQAEQRAKASERKAKVSADKADSLESAADHAVTAADSARGYKAALVSSRQTITELTGSVAELHTSLNAANIATADAQGQYVTEHRLRLDAEGLNSRLAAATRTANVCYAVNTRFLKVKCPSRTTVALVSLVGGGLLVETAHNALRR